MINRIGYLKKPVKYVFNEGEYRRGGGKSSISVVTNKTDYDENGVLVRNPVFDAKFKLVKVRQTWAGRPQFLLEDTAILWGPEYPSRGTPTLEKAQFYTSPALLVDIINNNRRDCSSNTNSLDGMFTLHKLGDEIFVRVVVSGKDDIAFF